MLKCIEISRCFPLQLDETTDVFILYEFWCSELGHENKKSLRICTNSAKAMTSWQRITGCGLKKLLHIWCGSLSEFFLSNFVETWPVNSFHLFSLLCKDLGTCPTIATHQSQMVIRGLSLMIEYVRQNEPTWQICSLAHINKGLQGLPWTALDMSDKVMKS